MSTSSVSSTPTQTPTPSPNSTSSTLTPNSIITSIPKALSMNPPNPGDHLLSDTWTMWYHDGVSDWTLNSYQKIYEFNTIEDFWRLYNNLPSIADHFFFLMKKGHPPIWDVPENIKGGAWLWKITKKEADSFWLRMSLYMIGNTMVQLQDLDTFGPEIIGISISPRNYNCSFKIWNKNSLKCKDKIKFNMDYPEFQNNQSLYKEFKDEK